MSNRQSRERIEVRPMRQEDIPAVVALSEKVYGAQGWKADHLAEQLARFSAGQLVARDTVRDAIVGNAASLILDWAEPVCGMTDYEVTGRGRFGTHDPLHGQYLYGADVCVDPDQRRMGIGRKLYAARRALCQAYNLRAIRAGARLRGYHRHARRLSPEAYVQAVVAGTLKDPTLSFQLQQGFRVVQVARDYLPGDAECLGHAAIIEWVNPQRVPARPPRTGLVRSAPQPTSPKAVEPPSPRPAVRAQP